MAPRRLCRGLLRHREGRLLLQGLARACGPVYLLFCLRSFPSRRAGWSAVRPNWARSASTTPTSLYFTTVFVLLVARPLNHPLERRGSRLALRPAELAALSIGLTVSFVAVWLARHLSLLIIRQS